MTSVSVVLRQAVQAVRDVPDKIARCLDRGVMAAHQPEPVEADRQQWPAGVQAWCLRCDEPWPCEEYAAAEERSATWAPHCG
jgi:hypothetical protein